jgi:uncharacterized protein
LHCKACAGSTIIWPTPILEQRILNVLTITWGDHELELHCERAVHWRHARTLIIADAHFGKTATFRHHGIPVPEGGTRADLMRLTSLLQRTNSNRLIILGDFLHARAGRSPAVLDAIEQWRKAHGSLEIVLVRGNHDQHAGDPPANLQFRCVDEPFAVDGLHCVHDPAAFAACGVGGGDGVGGSRPHVFAGHIHPCALLHDIDGSSMRSPCFFFSDSLAVLPAFGSFTGMHPVRPRRRKADARGCISHDRIFAVGPDEVIEIKRMKLARRS